MLLKLYPAGEPILRKKAKKLTKAQLSSVKTQALIDLMVETMRDHPGVGLSAPQVGELLQIIVIEDKAAYHKTIPAKILKEQGRTTIPLTVLVNPKIKVVEDIKALYFEGCLSVNGYRAVVPRVRSVVVNGWDREGNSVEIYAEGWKARILQHELDHLNGELYTDKMLPKSLMSDRIFAKNWQDADTKKIAKQWSESLDEPKH